MILIQQYENMSTTDKQSKVNFSSRDSLNSENDSSVIVDDSIMELSSRRWSERYRISSKLAVLWLLSRPWTFPETVEVRLKVLTPLVAYRAARPTSDNNRREDLWKLGTTQDVRGSQTSESPSSCCIFRKIRKYAPMKIPVTVSTTVRA